MSPAAWLDRLQQEHDNLRAALDRLEAAGETQLALLLGGTIWEFWCLRSHYAEGFRRLEHLLELDDRPTTARAKALTGAGHLAPNVAEGAAVERPRREQALALHRRLGDAWGVAFAELEFAGAFTGAGDFSSARPLFEQSVRRLRELGDEHRALQATRALAWCNLELGEVERAKALYGELLEGARAAGDRSMEARALSVFAAFASDEGRHEEALRLLEEAYRIDREYGDPSELVVSLIRFARALALAGRGHAAVQLLSRAEAMREEIGFLLPAYVIRDRETAEARARERLDADAFAEAWEYGRTLTPDDVVALVHDARV